MGNPSGNEKSIFLDFKNPTVMLWFDIDEGVRIELSLEPDIKYLISRALLRVDGLPAVWFVAQATRLKQLKSAVLIQPGENFNVPTRYPRIAIVGTIVSVGDSALRIEIFKRVVKPAKSLEREKA